MQVLSCEPASPWRKQIPAAYLDAFENAAARYELGQRGVWALAAVARMESNFGRGMDQAANCTRPGRSGSNRASGSATRSTATKTATSATPIRPTRPPPWRA